MSEFIWITFLLMYSISCSKLIVEKFQASPFIPPHGLFSPITRNPHWQTVIGSEAIRHKFFKLERNFNTKLERFKTKDNDFFDVEYTDNFEVSVKTVFILHGLESNPKGPLVTKMARSFLKRGFSCCIVSFRGCNGEDNDSPGAYHLGFTTDINQLVRTIHEKFPSKRLYLSGFSLGGNVVLKYLGELGEEAIALNIIGSVATCVPFDPTSCQKKLDQGFNRAVYSENFLSTLKAKAIVKHKRFPNSFDLNKVLSCKTIGDFDDTFMAPVFGFADKFDYYRKSGSIYYLNQIRIPSIVINARDDPFIEETSLPSNNDIGPNTPLRIIYHDYGGHCGFKAHDPPSENGWLAEEMGRVLHHIDEEHLRLIDTKEFNNYESSIKV